MNLITPEFISDSGHPIHFSKGVFFIIYIFFHLVIVSDHKKCIQGDNVRFLLTFITRLCEFRLLLRKCEWKIYKVCLFTTLFLYT